MGASMPGTYLSGEVTSPDGTRIGYRRYGTVGHGVVLVHGGGQAAQNLHLLATALTDQFTVYVPDRRGRGRSGPPGDHYGLAAEGDDLAALVRHAGAVHLFGLSSGGIVVLAAARSMPGLRSVAVYEPPLSINHSTPLGWLPRYERELARGDLAAAAVTAMRGTRTASLPVRLAPRPVLTAALNAAMRPRRDTVAGPGPGRPSPRRAAIARVLLWPLRQAARTRGTGHPGPDGVALRALVPTMRYDAQLVVESEGTLDDYATLVTPVLLLGGSRSASYLSRSLDALQQVLPNATRVELPGVGHTAPDNTGDPLRVADQLRGFFDDPKDRHPIARPEKDAGGRDTRPHRG
jgi:pimeloyl-ACP methyl ester carboxylesterase